MSPQGSQRTQGTPSISPIDTALVEMHGTRLLAAGQYQLIAVDTHGAPVARSGLVVW
ncbi:MAG: hypothetical protein KFH87_13190 [Bacteroidetes bacterium]|nr:hypothetical protein [Bacteroidota bacterium]